MPRKPVVPSIPEKPTGRTKQERSRVKHRPDPPPEQFDLWGAFAASHERDQTIEAASQPPAKARQRRGSRTSRSENLEGSFKPGKGQAQRR